MGENIHARRTPEGMRYRVWSSIVDAYLTEVATESELRDYLIENYSLRAIRAGEHEKPIAERIERANNRGTSSFVESAHDLDGPWKTERCRCGITHHEFNPKTTNGEWCRVCGDPRSDRIHNPPCRTHIP